MITFFLTKIDYLDLADMWFGKSDVTFRTAHEIMFQLSGKVGEQLILPLGRLADRLDFTYSVYF